MFHFFFRFLSFRFLAKSAGVVEFTDYFFVEGQDPPNVCPGYDTKQSDGEVRVMLTL